MPRGKRIKPKVKQPVIPPIPQEPQDLRQFATEAEMVALMTTHQGWEILRRDVENYKQEVIKKIVYLNPKTLEYEDARVLYIASCKLLQMVEDYAENRRRALELLNKIDNQEENIVLDMDNA